MEEFTNKDKFKTFLSRYGHYFWIAGLSFLFITVCSTCSFLYPNNEWSDSNIYFTVGKGLIEGKVLYRDIFDHKGLYIYWIHSFAYLISHRTFTGIYLLELPLAFILIYAEYKILSLYIEKKFALFCLPLTAFATYASYAMFYGDSAEELVLPFMAVSLFHLLQFSRGEKLSYIKYGAAGAFASYTFWIKYTMCGFFFGWAIIVLIFELKDKNYKHLLAGIGVFFAAFALVSVPVFIYFGVNGALGELWGVYFYDNLFVYTSGTEGNLVNVVKKIFWPLWLFIRSVFYGLTFYIFVLPGFLYLILSKDITRREKAAVFTVYGVMNFLFYAGGRGSVYYCLPVSIFSYTGIVALFKVKFTAKIRDKLLKKTCLAAGLCVLCLSGLSIAVNPIRYRIFQPRSSRVQYKFAELIENLHPSGNIINYGTLDLGVHTATDTVPDCKYFFKPNIALSEITKTQDDWILNGKADYVVCLSELPEALSGRYELVAALPQRSDQEIETYYLYALKDFLKDKTE